MSFAFVYSCHATMLILRFSRSHIDKLLRELYGIFNTLPGLLIHPPFATDSQIDELLDAGGYTPFGGVDVRVPLDVLRNLQV